LRRLVPPSWNGVFNYQRLRHANIGIQNAFNPMMIVKIDAEWGCLTACLKPSEYFQPKTH
jgi:hypothetical protein